MAETKTKVSLSSGKGAASHKPDCQCPFCKRKRGETVSFKEAAKPSKPEPEAKSSPTSQKREKADSSAETLQAAHDLGNAIWPDPRWELPDREALEWGETTVALRDRFEIADTILGGGIFGRPIAKLLKIERHRAIEIIPQQGLMRKRSKKQPESPDQMPLNGMTMPGDNIPLGAVEHQAWESMSEPERQQTIEQFRRTYGYGVGGGSPPIGVDVPPEGVSGR